MLGNTYASQNCSAARALEVVGERWSLLIVRDAMFRGIRRFGDFQRSLGIASNVLASRLDRFVASGLMRERACDDGSEYLEYVLTEKGASLRPVVIALTHWGDRWAAPSGPPILFDHACGGRVTQYEYCARCRSDVSGGEEILARPGPGRRAYPRRAAPTATAKPRKEPDARRKPKPRKTA